MRTESVLKTTMTILAVCFFIGITAQDGSAKDYEMKGWQKRGTGGTNAQLKCNAARIDEAVKITGVEGNNDGLATTWALHWGARPAEN
jgi:hypothetical protein